MKKVYVEDGILKCREMYRLEEIDYHVAKKRVEDHLISGCCFSDLKARFGRIFIPHEKIVEYVTEYQNTHPKYAHQSLGKKFRTSVRSYYNVVGVEECEYEFCMKKKILLETTNLPIDSISEILEYLLRRVPGCFVCKMLSKRNPGSVCGYCKTGKTQKNRDLINNAFAIQYPSINYKCPEEVEIIHKIYVENNLYPYS